MFPVKKQLTLENKLRFILNALQAPIYQSHFEHYSIKSYIFQFVSKRYDVLNACEENENTPSYAQAVEMRKLYKNGELDCDYVYEIMAREKANQRITVKIPQDRLSGKIPNGYNAQQTEDFIVKAVEYYHRYLQRQRENER